jgi:O-antigen/teichoic acid export membrane protein
LFYGEPILFPLLCVVGATTAISGFQTTAFAVASRKIRLARLTLLRLGGQVISIVITIALAWVYKSVWALAVGSIVGTSVQTILGHIVLRSHGHALQLEREAFGSLIRFGRWIFLSTLITFLGGGGMQLVQAKLVPMDTLGKLYIAGVIGWALGDLTNRVGDAVGFPTLAKVVRETPRRVRSVLDRIRVRLLVLTLPGFILLSLISTPLINTLYDARYAIVGDYLAITAINGAIAVLPMVYQNAVLAAGNSRVHFIVMSVFMVARLIGVVAGFYCGGVIGMLIGGGIAMLVGFFVAAKYAHDEGWLSPRTDAFAFAFIFAGACASYLVHAGTW